MNLSKLLHRTFRHYFANNLATSAGIAITTAIICGSLIIGDSLKNSLTRMVDDRLGNATHTLTSGDRIFTKQLANKIGIAAKVETAAMLRTEAVASIQGGAYKADKVQVWGIDADFAELQETSNELADDEAIISLNLSRKLLLKVGDSFSILIRKTGPIPGNTPFVSESDQTVSKRVIVKAIVNKDSLGSFNLQISQTAPFNIFVNLNWLNQAMGLKDKANVVLIKSELQTDVLQKAVRQACTLGDLNLLQSSPDRLTSERVFIEDEVANALKSKLPQASGVLTYFVNGLRLGLRETPYSFVSAVENRFEGLKDHETVLNAWLANDLKAKIGDSITVRYFVFGSLRSLVEKQTRLKVVNILPMSEVLQDSILMPQLPGLSDAGNCRDWKAGIPIDLKKIRSTDEAYWKSHKGAPKAYVSLDFGQKLWRNRYGSYTAFLLPKSEQILPNLDFNPFALQFQINEVRELGLISAKSGVDFGQLFAGLGMFIMASGLLLTILLFSLSLKRRENQIKLYTSLGFPKKLIQKIYLTEIFGISLIGTVIGLILTIGYSKLILLALNQLWNDIVRTDALELQFKVSTLLTGFLISLLLGMTVVFFATKRIINRVNKPQEAKPKRFTKLLAYGFLFACIVLVTLLVSSLLAENIFLWLLAGILLLLSSLFGAHAYFHQAGSKTSRRMDAKTLGWKNMTRNPARSFSIFALLALGSFVIVVTALNKKTAIDSSLDPHNGTGGFEFVAETTVPILRNLNEASTRKEFGLPDSVDYVQFLAAYDDQASCLNLNKIANPRILAINPSQLDGRFTFSGMLDALNSAQPWLELNHDLGTLIPAIADQSVIQWGLGKKIGDTLHYVGSHGESVKLLLVGGLSNSIFQGHVLISEENFRQHFSIGNGSSFLLVDCPENQKALIAEELNLVFKDKGWSMQSSVEKLAEFNSIENTYLSIFFLMGAFGMLLGIVGLSIFLIRNMLERKNELALYKAVGYKNNTILQILLYENLTLFLAGSLSGSLAAFLAAMPTLLQGGQTVPLGFLLIVLGILILNGIVWIGLVSIRIIRKTRLTEAFIND